MKSIYYSVICQVSNPVYISGVYYSLISEYSQSPYDIDSLLLLIMSANTNCHT